MKMSACPTGGIEENYFSKFWNSNKVFYIFIIL